MPYQGELVQALDGVRVLDLTRFVAGPYCTMLLADAGADVVKIEPLGGDETRSLMPMLENGSNESVSGYFLRFARNKRSVCIDLQSDVGASAFERLVAGADVVVENFRPGVMERLGFGYDRLRSVNPKVVYASISGFGHSPSPHANDPAFAILAEMQGGIAVESRHPGEPPVWTAIGIGDLYPASLTVGGVAMALYRAARTGRGCHVDMAMYDGVVSLNERVVAMTAMTGREHRLGAGGSYNAPFGLFKASDGWLCIAVIGEKLWHRFCELIDRPEMADDPKLQNGQMRSEQMEPWLRGEIEAWLAKRTRAEAEAHLLSGGIPAGRIQYAREILDSAQSEARSMITEYGSYAGVTARVTGNPIKLVHPGDGTPAHAMVVRSAPAPGEHTRTVLREFAGYSDEEVDALIASGGAAEWTNGRST